MQDEGRQESIRRLTTLPISPQKPNSSMNAFELMASALDISSILGKQSEGRLKKYHFTSRMPPVNIWRGLEAAVSERGGSLKEVEYPWRCIPRHKSS